MVSCMVQQNHAKKILRTVIYLFYNTIHRISLVRGFVVQYFYTII